MQKFDLATMFTVIDDLFPHLKNKKYILWIGSGAKLMLQCYEGENELYGHEYIVDIDKKSLIPYTI